VDVCPTGSLNLTKDYIYVTEDPNAFLWTPGIDNPNAKEDNIISYTSDTDTSLNMFDRVPMRELDGKERVKSFAEVVLGYSEEEARAEAQTILSEGKAASAKLKDEILNDAKEKAKSIAADATKQIQVEKEKAIAEIKSEVVNLSLSVAEKLIKKNLSAEDNKVLIDESLSHVKKYEA
jgi:vacuolar-type H+-ATPase subunit H